jgi:hypothetical protein
VSKSTFGDVTCSTVSTEVYVFYILVLRGFIKL